MRSDTPIEVNTTLDSSGNYTGPWIDTAGYKQLLLAHIVGTTVQAELSQDGANALVNSAGAVTNGSVLSFSTPYFRLKVVSGTANAVFWMSGRIWS